MPSTILQRPDVNKNIVSSNCSQFYEFGTMRNRARRSSTLAAKESPIELEYEEEAYDYDEETEISEQSMNADDDDYNPKPKSRVTRSASKISEMKPDLKYDIGKEYQQSDVSVSSITAIEKTSKRKFAEELIGSASKRQKKELSPMHPTASIKQSKAATSSDNPSLDQQFFINMFASFTADLDKKVESVIDKKLGKEQHIETKKNNIDDDNNDDIKNLSGNVGEDN
jgi:hypothetical protein